MKKPSILLITADELLKETLGCYGGKVIETPHIDALANSAARYQNAYCASPWCLPSRCSILTGLFPSHSGAYSNFRKCELSGRLPNMFTVFKENGYKTALSGKCHFAPVPYGKTKPDATLPYNEFREYYLSLGIDDLFLQDGKEVSGWFYDDYAAEIDKIGFLETYREVKSNRDNAKVYPFPETADLHPDAWAGRKMCNYVNSLQAGDNTMMWLSFSGPHYPFDAPEEYYLRVDMAALGNEELKKEEGEFDSPTRIHHKSYNGGGGIDGCHTAPERGCKNYTDEYWTRLRCSYYANVALIDDMVGEVVKAAKAKFGDDLLVIFTADHGEMLGNHGLWGKNNCAYEEVWKVPLLIKYPNNSAPKVLNDKVMLTDLFATCMGAAEIEGVKTDGKDLRKFGGHDYVFAEGEGYLAVSDGRYKYVHIKKPNEEFYELFDLETDPHEFKNKINDEACKDALIRLERQATTHFMNILLP